MTTSVRLSPSGPAVPGGLETTSSNVLNQSVVPDAETATETLNRLATSYDVTFREDFIGGRNSSSPGTTTTQEPYGQRRWTCYTGGGATAPLNRPSANLLSPPVVGAYNFNVGTSQTWLVLGGLPTAGGVGLDMRRIDELVWRGFPNSSSTTIGASLFGLASERVISPLAMGNNALYFQRNHTASPTPWSFVSRRSGTATTIPGPNNPFEYTELIVRRRSDGDFDVFIAGVSIGVLRANDAPIGLVTPAALATNINLAIDFCNVRYQRRRLS